MLHRSKASLGRMLLSVMAAGLCTLAMPAQQSATTTPPADASAAAKPADPKTAPASPSAASSSEPATGVANPELVVPESAPTGAEPGSPQRYAPEQPPTPAETQNGPSPSAEGSAAAPAAMPATSAADPTAETTPAVEIPAQQNVQATPDAAPTTPPQQPAAQPNVPATTDAPATPPSADTAATQSAPQTPAPAPDPTLPAPAPAQAPSPAPDATAPAPPPVDTTTTPKSDAPAVVPVPDQTPASSTEPPAAAPGAPSEPVPAPSASQTAPPQDSSATNPSMPAPQVNEPEPPPASKIDLFGGYAYLRPSGSVGSYKFPSNNTRGYIASGTYYFGRHIGVQAEFSHSEYPLGTTGVSSAPPFVQLGGVTDSFYTIEGGPVYRFFLGQRIIPFAHVVGGGVKIAGPKFQPLTWGYGVAAGGGVDVLLPHTHEHVAFRLAQADYEYMHADQGALTQYDLAGGSQDVTALRLSAGLVFRFGEMNTALPKSLACDASPSEVYAGERVTLAATLRNYQDKRKTPFVFNWQLSAGKQQGFGPVIFVDTTGMAGGVYHATAHISLKEKGRQFAQCSTNFTVKPSPMPTLKCSADPSTVTPGQTSTITAYANSIAQRQLTYSYTTSEGQINGTDNTAQLHTDGLPPGMATVTCKVKDDLGQTAIATTDVTIAPPALPPAPKAQPLCTVYFNRDMKRPARVDNEGRACLDDISLTLEHQPDARLVLVGEHSESEVDGQLTAAERAMNTRAYLANEKGIDPARVDVRTSTTPGRQVQTFLLAPGAIFDQPTEGRIDETKVPVHGQQYVNQRRSPQKGSGGHGTSRPPSN